ncbi:MAG: DUF1549 domain-containing protein [Lentisphaeraceae bacterium]|nr:DUF1549 domain-containing protein [Lentisphaeraceae bacterium]
MKFRIALLSLLFIMTSIYGQNFSKDEVLNKARKIDQLLQANMAKAGHYYKPRVGDDILMRRTYLDVIGRIPTWKEAKDFILSPRSDKHYRLIEKLLESDGYTSATFNYWADILRAVSRVDGGGSGEPYIHWLKNAMAENMPYDKFVQKMLSSNGSPYEEGNGAVGYYLRDPGMPLDNMANTIQVFLGTRIGCAQCHDHPFDRWTQMDFYKLAAFTGGVNTRSRGDKKIGMINKLAKKEEKNVQQQVRRIVREMSYGVSGSGTGMIKLPESYAYTDAKPNQLVTASVPFGNQPRIPELAAKNKVPEPVTSKKKKNNSRVPEINSREHFAEWVASPVNDRFNITIANRMWKKVMGLGLIEPVDDINDKTKASNPELMDFLVQLMKDCRYDLKLFQKVILNTRAYQSEALERALKPNEEYFYQAPIVSRLRSEQIWDSLVTLVVPDVDGRKAPDRSANNMYQEFKNKSPEEVIAYTKKIFENKEQAKEDRNSYNKIKREVDRRKKKLSAQLRQAKKSKDKAQEAKLNKEMAYLQNILKKAQAKLPEKKKKSSSMMSMDAAYRGFSREMMRASELPSPAKPGHFLRQFGQSERSMIDDATTDATVTQVLNLLNGFVDQNIVRNSKSFVITEIKKMSTMEDRLNTLYLSLYSRYPASREKSMMLNYIKQTGDTDKSYTDIIWALINTNEFMFRR